jgi:hypothetical protein
VNGSDRYDEVCDDLLHRHPGLERTKMMGMPSLKLDGKLVAGFVAGEDAMVFRFTDLAAHADALALEGSHLFDPTGKGRPFKDWVVVPPLHADRWLELAESAIS